MLKRFIWAISVALLTVFLCSIAVYASWVLKFPTNITDTSGSTRTYLPVMLGYGGQTLVDMGKISSNGTNTNMQIGTSNIKYMMATGNVTCVIPNLPATGIVTSDLYTGYSPEQTAFAIITGSGGYVTVTDSPTLELSNNFSVGVYGYVSTSASNVGSYLIWKQNAFYTKIGATNNITSSIINVGSTHSEILYPNAVGDYTNIASVTGAATHWDAVNDIAGAPDDGVTYVSTTSAVEEKDVYNITTPTESSDSLISSIDVHYRIYSNTSPPVSWGRAYLRLGGVEVAGNLNSVNAWTSFTDLALARPGGGNWLYSDLTNLQVGVGIYHSVGGGINTAFCTQIYVTVNYYDELKVSGAGISDADSVVTSANTTHLILTVDGVIVDSIALGGISVPNNANNWVILDGDVLPYTDNFTIYVDGVQQCYLAPNVMISGTTIPDRSGNAHTGAITWGSNSNISLSYGAMESYVDYIASINTTGGYDFPYASLPSTWFASGGNVTALPFYDAFSSVSLQTGQPVQMLYGLGIIGLAFGAFLLLVIFTRSALIGYIAMVMVFGIGASMTIIPAWIVFVLILVGAGIMYLYRQVAY